MPSSDFHRKSKNKKRIVPCRFSRLANLNHSYGPFRASNQLVEKINALSGFMPEMWHIIENKIRHSWI